jgi:hypothetical protein
MNKELQLHIENLHSADRNVQGASFQHLMKQTDQPVGWSSEARDSLLELLERGNNRGRSIAAQVLCNLAKSDPGSAVEMLPKLIAATRDEKFVTARHSLLALRRVGIVNEDLARQVVDGLSRRFEECIDEKNCTLIRYDIACVMRQIYDHTGNEEISERVRMLIGTETDPKYRKKYLKEWKDVQ